MRNGEKDRMCSTYPNSNPEYVLDSIIQKELVGKKNILIFLA
jgi:hypothetical protein